MLWPLIIPVIIYFILLLYISRGLLLQPKQKAGSSSHIPVSVIMACRNEEKRLPLLLDYLAEQDYPKRFIELIVVDDNSVDNTFSVAGSFDNNAGIKVLRNTGEGKKSAIRTGVMSASGNLIITTDADCRPNSSWISSLVSFYTAHKPDLLIGPVRLKEAPGLFHHLQELEFLSLQGITAGTANLGHPTMCNGANLAFSPDLYKRHAGSLYDEIPSGDDIFLMQRISAEKGRILWIDDPDSIVETEPSTTLKHFLKQRARWISKAGAYKDTFTILLAIITLAANTSLASLLLCSIFLPQLLITGLTAFILKSVPDLLILSVIAGRYKKRNLLWWFIPLQVIYPFYVITISAYSLFRKNKW